MAGFGTRILSVALAIPIAKLVNSKLEQGWRASTGTEPPSMFASKQQEKDNKKAAKLGLPPRPVEEPKFADALMWSGLSAMSFVLIKYASERGAEEVTKFFTGDNVDIGRRRASLHSSGKTGAKEGKAGSKLIAR